MLKGKEYVDRPEQYANYNKCRRRRQGDEVRRQPSRGTEETVWGTSEVTEGSKPLYQVKTQEFYINYINFAYHLNEILWVHMKSYFTIKKFYLGQPECFLIIQKIY